MKRRIFTAALACAMALSLLSACGPKTPPSSAGSSSAGSDVSAMGPGGASSQPDASLPDTSAPGDPLPDASQPEPQAPDASQPVSPAPPVDEPQAQNALSLSKNDFTLKSAGASWQLKAQTSSADGKLTWSSSDETVATVSDKGLVTAVAPGKATITVTDSQSGLTASCIVRCRWDEEKPQEGGSSSGSSSSKPSSGVDLQAFYDTTSSAYDMNFMMAAEGEALESYYAGLSNISTAQSVIYYCGMNPAPVGDFALVQVTDSKDVDKVKAIFQARIDYMVGDGNGPGGAWYPGPTTMWDEQSRIVSNGNYVMLIVHEKCDDIVNAFKGLF